MDKQFTDNVTHATAAWVTAALQELGPRQFEAFSKCLHLKGADIRVVVKLREGAIILDAAIKAKGKRIELFRQDVEPLRLH